MWLMITNKQLAKNKLIIDLIVVFIVVATKNSAIEYGYNVLSE